MALAPRELERGKRNTMKSKHRASAALTLFACASSAPVVFATSISLNSSKDNTLYEDPLGQTSNGMSQYFFVGKVGSTGAGTLRRGLLQFDLSTIPSTATVNSVTLQVYVDKSNGAGEVLSLHRVSKAWG